MKFFFDNNLPPILAPLAKTYFDDKIECFALRDLFPVDTTDIDWITALSKHSDYVVISKDRFAKGSQERQVYKNSNLSFFLLKSGWYGVQKHLIVSRFFAVLPEIVQLAERKRGAYLVPFKGKIERDN